MAAHSHAVIIAGGRGTRFWPLSRSSRPKQLLRLLGKKSLIRETADRVLPLFAPHKILVVSVAGHHVAIRKELPMLPKSNFLVEPQGRNTAPCIGLAALELSRRDPDAAMVVLPADHWIADAPLFRKTIRAALQQAEEQDALVTIGVRPTFPETGYGYILKGNERQTTGRMTCYRVQGFKEKPDLETASRLVRSGALWNSGIFVWKASVILELLQRFTPKIFVALERIANRAKGSGLGSSNLKLRRAVQREYKTMPSISIDYAVLEKAGAEGRVLTLKADFAWSDVGHWAAVHRLLSQDGSGNSGVGKWLGFKSKQCFIYSPARLVALLGVEDLVVVDTPDALLVADLRRSQEVRDLVEELERKGHRKYTAR